jgi:ATP-dependent protease ClpP protease subunit
MNRFKKTKNNTFYIMSEDECDDTTNKSIIKEGYTTVGTNQIYFYDDINKTSIYNLNRQLDYVSKNLLLVGINYNLNEVPPIELYINSEGGEVFSALSAVDRIISNNVPVHSYVEGMAASAATLLSVVAKKRYIRKNSFMLIHQINGGIWGNFSEVRDEVQNLELLMTSIKNIYLKYSNFDEEELDNLLKHDIYLSAEQCLEKNIVDEII